MPLHPTVLAEIARRFPPEQAAEAAALVEGAAIGTMREPASPLGRLRIHHAILRLAGDDLAKLREAVEIAERDWRDALVWSGLGGNWIAVLQRDGIDVDASA